MSAAKSKRMDGLHGVCPSVCLPAHSRARTRTHIRASACARTHTHSGSKGRQKEEKQLSLEGHRSVRSLARTLSKHVTMRLSVLTDR